MMFDGPDLAFVATAGEKGDEPNFRLKEAEALDKPWGRSLGMRLMPEWLFGGTPQRV